MAVTVNIPSFDPEFDVVEFNNMVTPYTNRLFNSLADGGLRIGVLSCTARERNRQWGAIEQQRYTHRVLRGIELRVAPRRLAHFNLGIWSALSRMKPRLLVLNGFYPSMLAAWGWARWTGTPFALRIDGSAGDMPQSAYHRIIRPMMLRGCRAILTPGIKGRRYFADHGLPGERLFEMPLIPAWDAPAVIPAGQARKTDLLWVAEIDESVKNAGFFVEIVRRLHARRPGLTVRVVGRDRAFGLARRLEEAGISLRYDVSLPWQGMADVFADARLLFLPSYREAWGLVCDEAMQCGTPCLVSPHVGAADDLVRDGVNGRVLPLDIHGWVTAAEALLDNLARWTAMSERARSDVSRRSIHASASIYRAMSALVLDEAPSRSGLGEQSPAVTDMSS